MAGKGAAGATGEPRRHEPAPTAEPMLCVIKLPCCRCIDGQTLTIPIHTGVAQWRVTPPTTQLAQTVMPASNSGWTASLPPASWVTSSVDSEEEGNYSYELQFYVSRCVIPSEIKVSGEFAADNSAKMYLDGTLIGTTAGFTSSQVAPFAGVVPPAAFGVHTLRADLFNGAPGVKAGPSGLLVRGTITIRCSDDPENGTLPSETGQD